MDKIADDWPYLELDFDADGVRTSDGPARPGDITDLVVISHGWHSEKGPRAWLYEPLLRNAAAALPTNPNRRVGVVGVVWPADEFNTDLSRQTTVGAGGGVAAVGAGMSDMPQTTMLARAEAVATFLGDDPKALSDAAYAAQAGAQDADDFIDRLRLLLNKAPADPQVSLDHRALLSDIPGRVLLQNWSAPFPDVGRPPGAGGVADFRLDFGNPLTDLYFGARSAIATALNQAAYFAMKERAGNIGAALGKLLEQDGLVNVRLHLIGHSFGARLVTAAAANLNHITARSLTLLQGAFSHNALGVSIPGLPDGGNGFYRDVIASKRVSGPISITHTWNDSAVGFWYPLASRLSNDVSKGFIGTTPTFGGPEDLHGGMGSNGALRLQAGEGDDRVFDGKTLPILAPGHVNSLHCDFILEHVDVTSLGCGRVVAAAMA